MGIAKLIVLESRSLQQQYKSYLWTSAIILLQCLHTFDRGSSMGASDGDKDNQDNVEHSCLTKRTIFLHAFSSLDLQVKTIWTLIFFVVVLSLRLPSEVDIWNVLFEGHLSTDCRSRWASSFKESLIGDSWRLIYMLCNDAYSCHVWQFRNISTHQFFRILPRPTFIKGLPYGWS